MKLKNLNKLFVMGMMSVSISSYANSHPSEPTEYVPVVNPATDCQYTKVETPSGVKEYDFLKNSDCSAYFALPPAVGKKEFEIAPSASLRLCKTYNLEHDYIIELRSTLFDLLKKLRSLESKMPKDAEEAEFLESQKQSVRESMADIDKMAREANAKIVETYANIEGARIAVHLDSRISVEDLIRYSYENEITKVLISQDGEQIAYPYRPYFVPASINKSIYSFAYVTPTQSGTDSIISTTIPGLEILQQNGGNIGTAHVKGGDLITGEVVLSLLGTCLGAQENADGSFSIADSNKNAVLAVNRTYEVQKQFRYGYDAVLKNNEFIKQVVEETFMSKNKGFTKEQVFDVVSTVTLDSFMEFRWDSNYSSEEHKFNGEMIMDIKKGLFTMFADDYFEALVKTGKLEVVEATEIAEAKGGYVDVDQVGTKCWNETKWFRRSRKCANYTYKVKEWTDGITEKDLTTVLDIGGVYREKVTVNEMIPFYFTTIFKR